MVEIEVQTKESNKQYGSGKVIGYERTRIRTVMLYHEWDLRDKEIVSDARAVTAADKGKFFAFNDGSGWHDEIIAANEYYVYGKCTIIRKNDIVWQCKPNCVTTNYSGVRKGEEHQHVRPYHPMEKSLSTKIINGTISDKAYVTTRIRVLTLDRIKEKLQDKGVNEEWLVARLLREADNMRGRGSDRLEAIKILSRAEGIELEKKTQSQSLERMPIFQQINMGTVQNQRRLMAEVPTLDELKEMAQEIRDVNCEEVS